MVSEVGIHGVHDMTIAWSYSSLQKFLSCPKRYFEERVAKSVKQVPSEQILWGERVHKALEVAVLTKSAPEGEFKIYESVVQQLLQIPGAFHAEQKLAITSSFKPTQWFAPDVWCRAVLDAVWVEKEVAKIVDYKTGKRKLDSKQLKLFALMLFHHHPEVDRINTAFLWLKEGEPKKPDIEKFKRKDVPILWQDILPDVRRLEYAHKTQTWIPKPGPLCNYCPVKTCSFWRGENGEGGQRSVFDGIKQVIS